MKRSLVLLLLMTAMSLSVYGQTGDKSAPDDSEKVAQQHLATFEKTGIPTPESVKAAFAKAKDENTVEAWELAARSANSYANVVHVLQDHYFNVYLSKKSEGGPIGLAEVYLKPAAEYEKTCNTYLAMRNDAYLNIAELYLQKGDKSRALSYAMTAVELGTSTPNYRGMTLIKTIIEYK